MNLDFEILGDEYLTAARRRVRSGLSGVTMLTSSNMPIGPTRFLAVDRSLRMPTQPVNDIGPHAMPVSVWSKIMESGPVCALNAFQVSNRLPLASAPTFSAFSSF